MAITKGEVVGGLGKGIREQLLGSAMCNVELVNHYIAHLILIQHSVNYTEIKIIKKDVLPLKFKILPKIIALKSRIKWTSNIREDTG